MPENKLDKLDIEIAKFYAPLVLGSLKYGENRICVWFPGSGKTTILNNILRSKSIINNELGNITKNLEIIFASGKDSINGTAEEIIEKIGIIKHFEDKNKLGKEIVVICDEIEMLNDSSLSKLLIYLWKIVNLNKARFHLILNVKNRYRIEKLITEKALFGIANQIKLIPILSDKLLKRFVEEKAVFFNSKISKGEIKKLIKETGGILLLTKEYLRNYNSNNLVELKLRAIWSRLPDIYKSFLLSERSSNKHNLATDDLTEMGVTKLSIFRNKLHLLVNNPEEEVLKYLTNSESEVLIYFQKNKGKLITKELLAQAIWGNNYLEEYSDWSLDQKISRLRKKMFKYGIDPENLQTIKGKGYIWN